MTAMVDAGWHPANFQGGWRRLHHARAYIGIAQRVANTLNTRRIFFTTAQHRVHVAMAATRTKGGRILPHNAGPAHSPAYGGRATLSGSARPGRGQPTALLDADAQIAFNVFT